MQRELGKYERENSFVPQGNKKEDYVGKFFGELEEGGLVLHCINYCE